MTKVQLYNITVQANGFLTNEISLVCHLKIWGIKESFDLPIS
jgi:hypothetical protein